MAENRPGIYRFTGPRGEVLYVGKSVRIRSRLLSYFRSDISSKQSDPLRVAKGIEWEYLPNEFEALLREFRQIRAFRPRFNRRHRGERRFAWIRLTGGAAPRLVATRRPIPSRCRLFGPFPAPPWLPALLQKLSVSVGLRDCALETPMHFADQADLFSPHRRPKCSRAELGTCPAPCAARCYAAEYADNVCEATRFLDGETDAPLDRLRSRMEEAAAAREFELAARLRDRERPLRVLRDDVVLFRDFLAGLTFLYRVPSEPTGPDRGYVLSGGRVLFSFSFTSDPDFLPALRDRVTAVLSQQMPTSYGTDVGIREEIFLVLCSQSLFRFADLGDDGLCRGGPDKGCGVIVSAIDVVVDRLD